MEHGPGGGHSRPYFRTRAKETAARVDMLVMHVSAHATSIPSNAQSLASLPQLQGKGGASHQARMNAVAQNNLAAFTAEDSSTLAAKGFASALPTQAESAPSSTGEDSPESQEGSASASAQEDPVSSGQEDSSTILTAQTYTERGFLIASTSQPAGSIFSATV